MQRLSNVFLVKPLAGFVLASILIAGAAAPVQAQSGVSDIWKTFKSVFGDSETQETQTESPATAAEADKAKSDAEAKQDAQKEPESILDWAVQVWHFPILKTGDSWVRLNQLIAALAILIVGWLLASLVSRLISRLFRLHPRIDQSSAIAIQKTLFYGLILIVLVLAVQAANLPLAFLTMLAAALAIGASIGAKNTIHDYLSGLILAVEKPVRVGDCIEVDDQRGFVSEIAGRFTILRRFDGVDVLVPNSDLLENHVVNWTLRDNKIRGDIFIGVVYGAPVHQVAELMQQAIDEHEAVLENPSASVQLSKFGDTSLVFWGWFWVDVQNPLDIWRIQSEIRLRIVELFREHDITIAYPQRDVHLDTPEPLSIQVAQGDRRIGRVLEAQTRNRENGRTENPRDRKAPEDLPPAARESAPAGQENSGRREVREAKDELQEDDGKEESKKEKDLNSRRGP